MIVILHGLEIKRMGNTVRELFVVDFAKLEEVTSN